MKIRMVLSLALAVMLLGTVSADCGAASKTGFPEREIKLIVPWNPGGGNDINARSLQPIFKKMFDADLIVENIAGGNGAVGTSQALTARPDGYTLGYGSPGYVALIAQDLVQLTLDNMDLIAVVVEEPITIYTKANSTYTSLQQVIDANKANPGIVKFAKTGNFSASYVFSNLLQRQTGTTFTMVPFDGSSRTITEILGGHMDVAISTLSDIISQVNDGAILPLAVCSKTRSPVLPDTPTVNELGYDMFALGDIIQAAFIMAPKGLKPEVKAELTRMFNEAAASEEYRAFAAKRGFSIPQLSEEEVKKYVGAMEAGLRVAAKEFPVQ